MTSACCSAATLVAPADGDYTFYLSTDTGALLRIHDATVIDADYGYVGGKEVSGMIKLKAGLHPVPALLCAPGCRDSRVEFLLERPRLRQAAYARSAFRRDGVRPGHSPCGPG